MGSSVKGNVSWETQDNSNYQEQFWGDAALIGAYDRAINKVKEEINQLQRQHSGSKQSFKGLPKKALKRQPKMNKRNQNRSNDNSVSKISWKEGDYCRAPSSHDGQMYEAQIKLADNSINACIVRFIGYGHEEEVLMEMMLPTEGRPARRRQTQKAKQKKLNETPKQPSIPSSDTVGIGDGIQRQESMENKLFNQPSLGCFPLIGPINTNCLYCPCHQINHAYASLATSQNDLISATNLAGQVNNEANIVPPPPPFPVQAKGEGKENDSMSIMLISWYLSGYHTGFYHGSKQGDNSNNT